MLVALAVLAAAVATPVLGAATAGDGAGAVVGADDSPAFAVTDVEAPETADAGASVTIQATVENEGESGNGTVTLWFAGEVVTEHERSLESGEQTTVTFEFTLPEETGEETWSVATSEGTKSGDIAVEKGDEPAAFEVEYVSTNNEQRAGETIEISTEIRNTGDTSGSQAVELVFDDEVVDVRFLSLDGGEAERLEFDFPLPRTGKTYEWRVVTENAEMGGETDVVLPTPATFVAEDISVPDARNASEDVTVSAEVRNAGEKRGSETFEFALDGTVIGTDSLQLNGGESGTVSFTTTLPDEPGTYDWSLTSEDSDESGTIEVQEVVEKATLSVEDATVEPGGETSVTLEATGEDIASFDADLEFNASAVQVVAVDDGDFEDTSVTIDNDAGVVELSAARDAGLDDPTLGRVTFTGVALSETETELTFRHGTSFFTEDVSTFDVESQSAELTVESTLTCNRGDVTGDGDVTVSDATLVQQYVTGEVGDDELEPPCADVNRDGTVTTADIVELLNRLV